MGSGRNPSLLLEGGAGRFPLPEGPWWASCLSCLLRSGDEKKDMTMHFALHCVLLRFLKKETSAEKQEGFAFLLSCMFSKNEAERKQSF